jgi:hypothetical protein
MAGVFGHNGRKKFKILKTTSENLSFSFFTNLIQNTKEEGPLKMIATD